MRIPRIYIDQPLAVGEQIDLPSDRAHYVANVLRLTQGRFLVLFNGLGGEYSATLVSAGKKSARVELESFDPVDRESALDLELAIGVSRGDKMDMIVQKATELGVRRISPLNTERTEVKFKSDRLEKKLEHWQQVVVSACEQSQRNRLPALNPPRELGTFLAECSAERKLILHPTCEGFQLGGSDCPTSASVLIGPEGGFSDEEVEVAQAQGFVGWHLGQRILRTETAPMAALTLLQFHWGDLA